MNLAWAAAPSCPIVRRGLTERFRRSPRRKEQSMIRSAVFALALIVAGGSAAFAQAKLTAQEQAACRPDAVKLCSSHVGKPVQMSACLRDNKADLSEACRAVVEAHGG